MKTSVLFSTVSLILKQNFSSVSMVSAKYENRDAG